mmetsp:Transcript_22240/g.56131  ORF Transcript_22240/g.56131 Transcript_22240/m.56131 type:complete len:216 (-) Transcript_22240:131-778(-)
MNDLQLFLFLLHHRFFERRVLVHGSSFFVHVRGRQIVFERERVEALVLPRVAVGLVPVPRVVVLVVGLRRPELVLRNPVLLERGRHLRDAVLLQLHDEVLDHRPLRLVVPPHARRVLDAHVRPLPLHLRRVVDLEEKLHELVVGNSLLIVLHLHGLEMAGRSGGDFAVGRRVDVAAHVAGSDFLHPRELLKKVLHTPETTRGKIGTHSLYSTSFS